MKLLVTGGAGFIGSNFVRYFLREHPEDEVVNLDALTYAGNLENLSDIEGDPRYTFVHGSITDRDLVFDLVKDVDAIVNFAAESHVDRSILDADAFVKTNVLGTLVLLDAALAHGKKRFHHVSTDEVFGSLGPDDPAFDENTPYAPRNPYSASKAASDHLVRAYFHTHGLPITISNCSNNYGPYHFPEKMIPLFISNLKEGKTVPVYGDGLQIRDWIYVEDHCSGVDAVLQKGKIGETYTLGDDNEVKNLDLTKTMIGLLGLSEDRIEFVKDRPGHDRRYATNSSKAREELGWEAKTTLEEGLRLTIDWYEDHKEWSDRCKSGAYKEYYEKNYGSK
ncbi:dTDP-glucose 4,6-dehydratase [Candidatus Uhrbacteria bacterium]|jgi:dTDP-glucose 4,6-dehydratase|nr:dTDP-glucose 4,6-dehydratase [Candidatus Uhrbacteria bacterium]